ncbi:hypothetical protein [Paralcaligenes ginsengisoli]
MAIKVFCLKNGLRMALAVGLYAGCVQVHVPAKADAGNWAGPQFIAQAQAAELPVVGLARNILADSGPSLGDLAPVHLYSVPEVSVEPPQGLPPADAADESVPSTDAQADAAGPSISELEEGWRTPDYAPSGWMPMGEVLTEEGTWVPDRTAGEGWTLGTHNWRYTRGNGTGLTLGNDLAAAPGWGNAARMGGIRFSQSLSNGNVAADQWQYSAMAGALDYSPKAATEGGLLYGPAAGNTVVRYGWTSSLTLESQLEWAPDMKNMGVGGQYDTHQWGVWKAGVAKASRDMHEGLRYQIGYETSILDTLKLSWTNEQRTAGFSDLSRYENFSTDAGGLTRNLLSATLPLGRWGDLTGSYEAIDTAAGPSREYLGVAQQFWLSPNLQVSLKADRDRLSGDYDVGLRFSIPIK